MSFETAKSSEAIFINKKMKKIILSELVRPHLMGLSPYSSARDDFQGDAQVFLDANENPFESGVNRYPDPHQREIKNLLSKIKNVPVGNIFVGNGSDEVIDLLLRAICEPGKDNIIIVPPTYGMYKVSAKISNVVVKEVLLDSVFDLDVQKILQTVTKETKIIFLCSPNNPTGNSLSRDRIKKILDGFNGLVVVDEAYIDFSEEPSLTNWLSEYQNLVVLQTLSKAWGMASIRLGLCLALSEIVSLLDKIKPPYNVSGPNQKEAIQGLRNYSSLPARVEEIKQQRKYLVAELMNIKVVQKIYDSTANFLLIKTVNAGAIYEYLTKSGIIVRNRSREPGCENCLRITVGTKEENDLLIQKLKAYA